MPGPSGPLGRGRDRADLDLTISRRLNLAAAPAWHAAGPGARLPTARARMPRPRDGASPPRPPRATASAPSHVRDGTRAWSAAATVVPVNGLSSGVMSRIVSVWLKAWPIARLLRAQGASPLTPSSGCTPRPLVVRWSLSRPARAVRASSPATGGAPAGPRRRRPALQRPLQGARPANPRRRPGRRRRTPAQLALWALRYTPSVAPWDEASGADGLFLDITGCAHLFGGEAALLADLARALARLRSAARGWPSPDTAGAAWALARHGPCRAQHRAGRSGEALRDLPLAALRFSEAALSLLRRLGFRRIGE